VKSQIEINIGRRDVIWNYLATFLQIGSGVLLFPFLLRMLPSETIGVWSIFVSISSFIALLDFGFAPSFTRNITYIFSGVNKLEKKGISDDFLHGNINSNLLSGTIRAMRWFYSRIALIALLLLFTAGSFYLYKVINKSFTGDVLQVGIAWLLFCIINTYNIYTLYYDSLVMGTGKVMRNKQIIIVSQSLYFFITVILIFCGLGLLAIVLAQAVALLVRRYLLHRLFFTPELKEILNDAKNDDFKEIIRILTPNSIKLGLTSVGAYMVLQSSVIVGSLFLSLEQIASYGITVQVVNVVASLSAVYFSSYVPKISKLRVESDLRSVKMLYFKSVLILFITFLICGFLIIALGNQILIILESKTLLLNSGITAIIILVTFLEKNHAIAGGFLLTKNEVPYFKASIISGVVTVILLFVFLRIFNWGVWGMILAQGLTQAAYQNWKWPLYLMKDLKQ